MAIKLGKNSVNYLLPAIVGGGLGILIYGWYMQKEFEAKLAAAREEAMSDIHNEVLDGGINSSGYRYNTTPYIGRSSTTEWNPENLSLSGSISDAGYGSVIATPRSPI